jgi:hypothetical protein
MVCKMGKAVVEIDVTERGSVGYGARVLDNVPHSEYTDATGERGECSGAQQLRLF